MVMSSYSLQLLYIWRCPLFFFFFWSFDFWKIYSLGIKFWVTFQYFKGITSWLLCFQWEMFFILIFVHIKSLFSGCSKIFFFIISVEQFDYDVLWCGFLFFSFFLFSFWCVCCAGDNPRTTVMLRKFSTTESILRNYPQRGNHKRWAKEWETWKRTTAQAYTEGKNKPEKWRGKQI